MCHAGLKTKRNPARISERPSMTQLMAAFRTDNAKPLGADACQCAVNTSLLMTLLTMSNTRWATQRN